MKNKILLSLLIILCLFTIIGCGNSQESKNGSNTEGNSSTNNENKLDHKVYKYMKISSSTTSGIMNTAYIFDDPSSVSSGDTEYDPCFVVEFDTKTGKATSVKFYSFFLDYENTSEWVDKAIEKYNESSGEYKKSFSNVSKGRVNESVTYLVADVNPSSHVYNQYVESLLYEQDIEEYKDSIYYSRLYNYSTTPPVEVGDNFFEESLENIRIEWSDSEIKPY